MESYQKSLTILKAAYGTEEHPEIATTESDLAWILFRQGKYAESERLYVRSLKVRETFLGENHPDVARYVLFYPHLSTKF